MVTMIKALKNRFFERNEAKGVVVTANDNFMIELVV